MACIFFSNIWVVKSGQISRVCNRSKRSRSLTLFTRKRTEFWLCPWFVQKKFYRFSSGRGLSDQQDLLPCGWFGFFGHPIVFEDLLDRNPVLFGDIP